MDDKERRQRRAEAARRRKQRVMKVRIAILAVLIIALAALIVIFLKQTKGQNKPAAEAAVSTVSTETSAEGETGEVMESEGIPMENETQEPVAPAPPAGSREELIYFAKAKATQYDYQGAIDLLNTAENAQSDTEIAGLISEYQNALASLVPTDPHNVTHVFFHTLVVDPGRGFSMRDDVPGWNNGTEGFCEWMTTVDEFNRILDKMYERGYVLISLYDMLDETVGEDGVVYTSPKNIMLPEGKIPFVMSLDDLSYYHSYDGRGCATKMIVGEDGTPTCEYVDENGNTLVGSYDCVPLLDDFIDAHPDFSYKGAKGTIAFTGYNGIFGYRTDYCYRDRVELTADQEAWLAIHPEYNWDVECANAKAVADCVRADGWTFASHTWGHMHIGDADYSRVVADTDKWMTYVKPLLGEVDCIIFAHGQDLPGWGPEYATSDKFQYLKANGFNIFCNVDSSQYFVDFGDTFMRMGRRNLDGYRLYQEKFNNADKVSDLFNVEDIWDYNRPTDPELYDLM